MNGMLSINPLFWFILALRSCRGGYLKVSCYCHTMVIKLMVILSFDLGSNLSIV